MSFARQNTTRCQEPQIVCATYFRNHFQDHRTKSTTNISNSTDSNNCLSLIFIFFLQDGIFSPNRTRVKRVLNCHSVSPRVALVCLPRAHLACIAKSTGSRNTRGRRQGVFERESEAAQNLCSDFLLDIIDCISLLSRCNKYSSWILEEMRRRKR